MSEIKIDPNGQSQLYEELFTRNDEHLRLVSRVKDLEKRINTLEEILVKTDGKNLQYIENQTDALCNLAIEQDGRNLQYIYSKTLEICKKAIILNPYAVEFCPFNEFYERAVKANGLTLGLISYYDRTRELCLLAVSQSPDAVVFVPQTQGHIQAWMNGIYHNPYHIADVLPTSTIYDRLKQYAFDKDPMVYPILHEPTEEMTIKFIQQCPTDDWDTCKQYITKEHKSFKVRMYMILKSLKFWYKQ